MERLEEVFPTQTIATGHTGYSLDGGIYMLCKQAERMGQLAVINYIKSLLPPEEQA